jgi:Family of unknown function (DUF6510)
MEDRRLDGNAIGGVLLELFATELTAATSVCGSCGAVEQLATMHVYMDAPGIVGRCCQCDAVQLRIVRAPGRTWIDMRGMRSLELPG